MKLTHYESSNVELWNLAAYLAGKAHKMLWEASGIGKVYLVYKEDKPDVNVHYENIPLGYFRDIVLTGDLTQDMMKHRLYNALRKLPVYEV